MRVKLHTAPFFVAMAARGAAIATALLGAVVLASQHFNPPRIAGVQESLAPMQSNAALCFLIAGCALGATLLKRHILSLILGAVTVLIGLLTLFQNFLPLDSGFHYLLSRREDFPISPYSGSMSPFTAVAFILAGLALTVGGIKTARKFGPRISALLGLLVVVLGTIALLNHFLALTLTYGWEQLTAMALHTAIGLIVLGLGLMASAWRGRLIETAKLPVWMPPAAGVAALTLTLILWNSLTLREKSEISRTVSANADTVGNEIIARLDSRLRAMNRMAKRWEFSGRPERSSWQDEAMYYVKDFPGYQGIAWADAETRAQWVVPPEGSSIQIGKAFGADTPANEAFEKARSSGDPGFSRTLQLADGGSGILLPIPISPKGEFDGYLVGIFGTEPLFSSLLPPTIAPGYSVKIRESGNLIYQRKGLPEQASRGYGKSLPIDFHGAQWVLEVEPGAEMLSSLRSPYPLAVLVFGSIFSALLAWSIHLARGLTVRSLMMTDKNSELKNQIAERKSAERSLQELGTLQRGIVSHAAYSVISTTPEGIVTSFNPAAERMLGYGSGEIVNKANAVVFHDPGEIRKRAKELSMELGAQLEPGSDVLFARARLGEVEHREWIYVRKDGSRLPVNLGVTALRDQEGEITGYLGIAGDISELKLAVSDLETTHAKLVIASHRAGMAEVATSVLHNVGNVLNSVNTSCSIVAEKVRGSRIESVAKTAGLLRAQGEGLAQFLTEDPKGKKLPEFLEKLAAHLREEQGQILTEVDLLSKNIDHINAIVTMQQGYAMVSSVREPVSIIDLIEDSIRMNSGSLIRHEVAITRDFAEVPLVSVAKHKALQILINVISNAKHACQLITGDRREVTIRVRSEEGYVVTDVIDNGVGIPEENMTRIFAHGFTTKVDGHGFGLHGSALSATQMGGSLTAHSEGRGKGARFSLRFRIAKNPSTTPE